MRQLTRMLTRGIVTAALLTLGTQVPAQAQAVALPGTTLRASGTEIFVRFLNSEAGYSSDIHFFVAVAGSSTFLFNNHAGDPTNTIRIGDLVAGDELIFGIYVTNRRTGEVNLFFSGDGSRNADGLVHAKVVALGNGKFQLGFEDLYGGGDFDYDDVVFEVSGAIVNPEPVTMVLLGSGLFGLGAAARRRRKGELV